MIRWMNWRCSVVMSCDTVHTCTLQSSARSSRSVKLQADSHHKRCHEMLATNTQPRNSYLETSFDLSLSWSRRVFCSTYFAKSPQFQTLLSLVFLPTYPFPTLPSNSTQASTRATGILCCFIHGSLNLSKWCFHPSLSYDAYRKRRRRWSPSPSC